MKVWETLRVCQKKALLSRAKRPAGPLPQKGPSCRECFTKLFYAKKTKRNLTPLKAEEQNHLSAAYGPQGVYFLSYHSPLHPKQEHEIFQALKAEK